MTCCHNCWLVCKTVWNSDDIIQNICEILHGGYKFTVFKVDDGVFA